MADWDLTIEYRRMIKFNITDLCPDRVQIDRRVQFKTPEKKICLVIDMSKTAGKIRTIAQGIHQRGIGHG